MLAEKKQIVSGLIIFLLFWAKFLVPDFFLFKKKPQMIKGLSSDIYLAEKQLNIRLREKFSPKTLNTEIVNELSKQGFVVKRSEENKLTASYEEHNIACRLVWSIAWNINNKKYIYNLEAKYNTTCL